MRRTILLLLALSCAKDQSALGKYPCTADQQCLSGDTCIPGNVCLPTRAVEEFSPCIPGKTDCGNFYTCVGGKVDGIQEDISVPYFCGEANLCEIGVAHFSGGGCTPIPNLNGTCAAPLTPMAVHSTCPTGSAVNCQGFNQACFKISDGTCANDCTNGGNICSGVLFALCLPPGGQ